MQVKSDPIRIKRKTILYFLAVIITLAIATPVLADYLGPDRTVTEWSSSCKVVLFKCQFVPAKNDWRYRRNQDWSCSNESEPWQAHSSNPSSQGCFDATAGDTYWRKEETLEEITTTNPPATISSSLQNCTLQNGWCVTSPQLELSANEPLSGYNILAVEGTLNGQTFACSDSSCSISLSEGNNDFAYWALSSWGDSSTMGTLSAIVDTVSPNVGLDISGSNGTNGWFVSPVTLTATGSDSTSGLADASLSVDGGAWQSSTTLNEGVYGVSVSASDYAGNSASSSTTISVDTTTPSLNILFNGTAGKNGWYVSTTDASVSASDTTSGIGTLEVAMDKGTYQPYSSSVSFSDGLHTIQFKATDNAGNFTESTVQSFSVDTIPPEIFMPESWSLGETIEYTTQDNGSELASLRVVIEDEDEQFAKVAWNAPVSGAKFTGEIQWNGKFKDGTVAPPGTYLVWIKSSDVAGNEHIALGRVVVPEPNVLFGLFQTSNSSTEPPLPPDDLSEFDDSALTTSSNNFTFGSSVTEVKETSNLSVTLSTGKASSNSGSSSNVLWGTTAAAIIAAATAYALDERRKRKEEEDRQRAEKQAEIAEKNAQREAAEKARKVQQWLEGQSILNARIAEAKKHGATDEQIAALKQMGSTQGLGVAIGATEDLIVKKISDAQERDAALQAWRKAERESIMVEQSSEDDLQAGLAAYYASMRQGEIQAVNTKPGWWKNAWDKTVNWIDSNQALASIITGAVVGLATIAIVATAPITLTALAIGTLVAVAVTVTIVSAGTVALNHANNRPLTTSLKSNVLLGGGTAFIVAGLGLALTGGFVTQAFIATGNAIAGACASSPSAMTACSQIGPVVDALEQGSLATQMTIQVALGDQEGAAQTSIEYQMELMDGGAPGNSVALELSEQLAKLGDDATELITKHGDEIAPLLLSYGDDAVDIIGAYGDDGIKLLSTYGDEAVTLINSYGTPAVDVLRAVDPPAAKTLLETLDDDVLAYSIQQGPDAVSALSKWDKNILEAHGVELALRSGQDAKVLADVKNLIDSGKIDPTNLTPKQQSLINDIAANSTYYTDGGQVALGKWFGFDSGYAGYANDTGSINYYPHQEMWNLLGDLGDENRDQVAWLINKQAIQPMIDKGMPFEYTLNGIDPDKIRNESAAIQAIWDGASDIEIIDALDLAYLPGRMKELMELKQAGYILSLDASTNSYILLLP